MHQEPIGGKIRLQFFTGQAWRGEVGLGCLVPRTGVANVSITDGAPTWWRGIQEVSLLFRCQDARGGGLQMIRASHLHLHEHERPPFASQHMPQTQRFTSCPK